MKTLKLAIATFAIVAATTSAFADDSGGLNNQPVHASGMTASFNAPLARIASGTEFGSKSDAKLLLQLRTEGDVAVDRN